MRAWLIGAALIAVLLGVIGCGAPEGSPGGTDPGEPAPLSVIRRGSEFTLTGDVADPAAKRALLDAVLTSTDDATVVDELGVAPSATTPDLSVAAPVFETASVIGDFSLRTTGDTVTLGGTAAKASEAAAVQEAAEQAWPRTHIVNELAIGSPG